MTENTVLSTALRTENIRKKKKKKLLMVMTMLPVNWLFITCQTLTALSTSNFFFKSNSHHLTPKPILPLVSPFPHLRVFTSCWGPHLRLFFRVDFFFFFFPLEEGGGVKSLSWEALWGAQKSGIRGPGGSPIPPTRAVAAGEAGPRSLEDEGPVSNT